ncbi:cell division site-positioning protein MapZ family protein [Enterococcus asini]|uniref:cell division site-positioning protein MapZ family protein n=1 Tax=Enterococcus asini TaxID=57732 RepID=UPI00288CF724|nr:cell division site-positioning protein MapZ family protein [Enterococcus asini]MDT2756733.1 cell division site-positioning protein MapZ family protein [Enterococcus asini]
MINTCPHCGFEPLNGKLVCPRCGQEIEENIAHKLQDIDEKNRKNNDSIAWNEFQNVSLGALMNHLENKSEENKTDLKKVVADEDASKIEATKIDEITAEAVSKSVHSSESADELADNPILSAYIKRHKEGKEEGPSLEELVAAQQVAEKNMDSESSEAKTVELEAEELEHLDEESRDNTIDSDVPEPVVEPQEQAASEASTDFEEELPEELVSEELLVSESKDPLISVEEESTSEAKDLPVSESAENNLKEETASSNLEKVAEMQPATSAEEIPVELANPVEEVESISEPVATASEEKSFEAEPAVSKPKTSRKKWPIVLAATVLLAGGGSAYAYHQHQEVQAQKQAQAELNAEIKDLQKEVDALYLDENKEYLKAGITTEEVKKTMDKVTDLGANEETKELKAELVDIEEKLDLQNQVNALFVKPVISGDQLAKDVPLASQEAITLKVSGPDSFDQLLAQGVQNAKEQLDQLNNAQAAVTALIKDGKAIANPKEVDYQAAQKLVTALVASDEKTELSDKLKLVETKINENKAAEKAAQEKAAAEKAAAEKAAQEKAAQQNSTNANSSLPAEASPNMQTNSANQPILANDAADIADTGNPAWTWNSGVLDKVLATCIQRGYIVAGGYKLEPVRIENGEGYYNLYATTNKAPLTANYKDSDLPLYLVTINCKTGYFRGNGNDHTIR